MPTLIRLIVFLGFLAGIAFAGMFALTVFVDPGTKEITNRIPARDLEVNVQARQGQAQVPRPLVNSEPEPTAETEPAAAIAPGADADVPE